jgi:hypothetical protein
MECHSCGHGFQSIGLPSPSESAMRNSHGHKAAQLVEVPSISNRGSSHSAAFDVVFRPLRTTLRKLSFLQIRHNVPYNGTHMELSGFRNLVDLEITSCCLLPPGPPCEARNMLCELLRASLRKLKVCQATGITQWSTNQSLTQLVFPREAGMFFSHLEDNCPSHDRFKLPGKSFMTLDSFALPSTWYTWIAVFLRHKATNYPDLAQVDVEDPFGAVSYWYWRRTVWPLPQELSELLSEQALDLSVESTYPHPDSSMAFYCRSTPEENT